MIHDAWCLDALGRHALKRSTITSTSDHHHVAPWKTILPVDRFVDDQLALTSAHNPTPHLSLTPAAALTLCPHSYLVRCSRHPSISGFWSHPVPVVSRLSLCSRLYDIHFYLLSSLSSTTPPLNLLLHSRSFGLRINLLCRRRPAI